MYFLFWILLYMHLNASHRNGYLAQIGMEITAFTIHLVVPVILMTTFIILYHGMWTS